jgi:hypothetical protein
MPWFWRNKAKVVDNSNEDEKKSEFVKDDTEVFETEPDIAERAQNLMADNLDIMRDIIFRIREDEEFAKSIYANCPRLQHMLKDHPDLRPIFEDPNLVRINLEKVYRDQGGVLPDDDDDDDDEPGFFRQKYEWLMGKIAIVTSHPLFRVFKVLMLIKKIVGLFSPTKGFSFIKGFMVGLFQDPDVLPENPEDLDGNPANLELRLQLSAAAEHMEDPEVQERMEEMLENPDTMEETIENDPQLKALRDENELCAALMSNPDTMRILIDPENLRALAEAPDLIEKDFADPTGFTPPVEVTEVTSPEITTDVPTSVDQEEIGRAALLESRGDRVFPDEITAPTTDISTEDLMENDDAEPPEDEEDGDILQDIADNREDAGDENNANRAKGLTKRSTNNNKEGQKDEAKSWTQAAMGVLGGQALASIGLDSSLFGETLDGSLFGTDEAEVTLEAPTVEGGEGELVVAPEDSILPENDDDEDDDEEEEEEEEGGIELEQMEVSEGAKQTQSTSRNNQGKDTNNEEGGIFGTLASTAKGYALGSALGSVISADQMAILTRVQENLAEQRKDEEDGESRGINDGETPENDRVHTWNTIKAGVLAVTIGGIIGQDVVNSALDVKDDAEELKEGNDEKGDREITKKSPS